MDDKKYLKYGNDEIDLEAFMLSLGDAELYVNSTNWPRKYKEMFMLAYLNIISQGIVGAHQDERGSWFIDHAGLPINVSSMDEKLQWAYGAAANYLQEKMASIPKRKRIPFTNELFTTGVDTGIKNSYFGGRKDFSLSKDWDELDPRNDKGERSIAKRSEALAKTLEDYLKNFKDDDYDFKNSPFTDVNDFRTRVTNAITALRSEDPNDDKDALNKIGLDKNKYFSNGLNDKYTIPEGYTGTYGDYYGRYLPELERAKQEKEAAEKEAELKLKEESKEEQEDLLFEEAPGGVFSSAMAKVYNPQMLASIFLEGNIESSLTALSQQPKLSLNDWGKINGAFEFAKQNNLLTSLSDDEKKLLGRDDLQKINGVEGLYYDPTKGKVVRVGSKKAISELTSLSSLLSQYRTGTPSKEEFLNSEIPGLTSADKKDLWAIGLDIASIVDPEPITAAVASTGAAELRRLALNESGHKWGLWDYIGQGLDYLTGAIGAVPVLGDTVLGIKTASNITKAIGKLTPILRKMARAGAWKDIYDGLGPSVKAVADKIINGENLTVGDWKDLGQLIRGIAGHRALNRTNLAERRVLLKSGYDVSGSTRSLKLGFARTKVGQTSEKITNEIEIKVDGERTKIKLSDSSAEQLTKDLKEAGHSKTKRDAAVARLKEVKDKYPTLEGKEGPKIEAPEAGLTDWKYVPEFIRSNPIKSNKTGWIKSKWNWLKETSPQGSNLLNVSRGNDEFNEYLKSRNAWDRIKFGTDKLLKRIREGLGLNNISTSTTSSSRFQNPRVEQAKQDLKKIKPDPFQHITPTTTKLPKILNKDIIIKNTPEGEIKIKFEDKNINFNGSPLHGTLMLLKQQLGRRLIEVLNRMRQLKVDSKQYKEMLKLMELLAKNNFLYKQGGVLKQDNELKLIKIIEDYV